MSTRIVLAMLAMSMLAWAAPGADAQQRSEEQRSRRSEARRAALEKRAQAAERAAEQERQEPLPQERSVRFEATVFQVELDAERVVELDANWLASRAESPAALARVLRGYGPTSVQYRVDQGIMLNERGGRATVARDTPMVTGSVMTTGGQLQTSISRHKVGGQFEVSGRLLEGDGPPRASVSVDVEISMATDSVVDVGADVTAPVYWNVEQNYAGVAELGKPIVLLTADGSYTTSEGKVLAFVNLVRLSDANEKPARPEPIRSPQQRGGNSSGRGRGRS